MQRKLEYMFKFKSGCNSSGRFVASRACGGSLDPVRVVCG